MWSNFLAPVRQRVLLNSVQCGAYSADRRQCRTPSCCSSRRLSTDVSISVLTASEVCDDWTNRSCRSWKKNRTSRAMQCWPWIRTPRFDTAVENCTLADSKNSSVAESLSNCGCLPSQISRSYRRSPFADCWTQPTNMFDAFKHWWTLKDVTGALMYTCVSPAYEWSVSPERATTSNSSSVYRRNSNGTPWNSCMMNANDRHNVLAACERTGTTWFTAALCLWYQTAAPDDVTGCRGPRGLRQHRDQAERTTWHLDMWRRKRRGIRQRQGRSLR